MRTLEAMTPGARPARADPTTSDLSGAFEAIIANNNFTGVATVEIQPGDVAFETTCSWTPVG